MSAELPTQWRVYRKEWLQVGKYDTDAEAEAAAAVYEERLEPDDVKIIDGVVGIRRVLWVRTWTVIGEFKHQRDAESSKAARKGDEVEVVERNSRAEHQLRDYGKIKLRVVK